MISFDAALIMIIDQALSSGAYLRVSALSSILLPITKFDFSGSRLDALQARITTHADIIQQQTFQLVFFAEMGEDPREFLQLIDDDSLAGSLSQSSNFVLIDAGVPAPNSFYYDEHLYTGELKVSIATHDLVALNTISHATQLFFNAATLSRHAAASTKLPLGQVHINGIVGFEIENFEFIGGNAIPSEEALEAVALQLDYDYTLQGG